MFTRTLVINDLHRPFHDPEALKVVLDIIKDCEIDRILLNGDVLDMYNVNRHGPTHPLVGSLLDDEISDTRMWLEKLRDEFSRTEIVFLYGNHEYRLERFIITHCRQLFKIFSLEKELGLSKLKIPFYHYNHRYVLDRTDLAVQHSPPSYGKNGAMTSLERDIDQSSIYGCSHRQQHATKTGKSGKQYHCYFNGWLGSTSLTKAHAKVFDYIKGHENWQQCFSIVTTKPGADAWVEQININQGQALYHGYLYGV